VAIALGITLIFGVISVTIETRATTDGYYPFYNFGTEGGRKPEYTEHELVDAYTGYFDPTETTAYHEGLKKGAQEKVKGLLIDLLRMPNSDWARRYNVPARSLWIEQLFTYGNSFYNPLLDKRIDTLYTLPSPLKQDENGDPAG
jgi:hypothetical protein